MTPADPIQDAINDTYIRESRRVLATLIRLIGDFDQAEEALQDAFKAALEQWPREGIPASPRAWLVSTGRFKAIDSIRRRARFAALDDVGAKADVGAEERLGRRRKRRGRSPPSDLHVLPPRAVAGCAGGADAS